MTTLERWESFWNQGGQMVNRLNIVIAFAFGVAVDIAASSLPAHAGLAIDFTSTTEDTYGDNNSRNIGWEFTPLQNITVTGLGFFDWQGVLNQSHPVRIYSDNGSLLVSATVPAGLSGDQVGPFRFVSVPATVLSAGQTY
jgi:Domain of unknown function (DUF4082)